jgi:hypothetical protein
VRQASNMVFSDKLLSGLWKMDSAVVQMKL